MGTLHWKKEEEHATESKTKIKAKLDHTLSVLSCAPAFGRTPAYGMVLPDFLQTDNNTEGGDACRQRENV